MLTNETKRRIDNCRDILVGKLPDPKSQVEQITIALIYKFMDDMDRFLRPRRFGKSLFVSLLEYYYDKQYKELDIFDNLYIGKNHTKLKSSYYVLSFTFSGIDTKTEESTEEGFNNRVENGIKRFLNRHNIDMHIDATKSAGEMLDDFQTEIQEYIDGKIYLLIDEYDHFANELLGFNEETPSLPPPNLGGGKVGVVSKNGFVRKFYEVIKEGTKIGVVDRIFITGVTPITLDSMTSGFNIGSDFTLKPLLNEMMGFTTEEVYKLAENTIKDTFDIGETINHLKLYYDGYNFHRKSKHHLYNSDMVLYYINEIQQTGEEPENMIDSNIASDYGKIGKLFEVGGRDSKRMDVLKSIIKGNLQFVVMQRKFNLEIEFTLDDFKTLLFYMGLMTIKEVDEFGDTYIGLPNQVIRELYFEYFQKLIEDETNFKVESKGIAAAIKEVARDGKLSKLIELTETTLKKLSDRDFLKFEEKYVKIIMLGFLFKSKLYTVKSEYPVEDGYIDIALLRGRVGNPKHYALIEIKYIKKSDFSEELIEKKLNDAKTQLDRYVQADELKDMPNLKRFALVFCGDKCVREEIL